MTQHLRPLDHIALASTSPRRRELLLSLGLRVDVVASRYVETPLVGLSPLEVAVAHARGKAAGANPTTGLIVAADTVVDVDGLEFGKPRDLAESRSMLERLRGRSHDVHTGLALRDDRSGQTLVHVESTRVFFGSVDAAVIDAYVASGDGLDKAGAYGIQGFAATLVDRIEGDYFTVVGFPLAAFARLLPRLGYTLQPASGNAPRRDGRMSEVLQ